MDPTSSTPRVLRLVKPTPSSTRYLDRSSSDAVVNESTPLIHRRPYSAPVKSVTVDVLAARTRCSVPCTSQNGKQSQTDDELYGVGPSIWREMGAVRHPFYAGQVKKQTCSAAVDARIMTSCAMMSGLLNQTTEKSTPLTFQEGLPKQAVFNEGEKLKEYEEAEQDRQKGKKRKSDESSQYVSQRKEYSVNFCQGQANGDVYKEVGQENDYFQFYRPGQCDQYRALRSKVQVVEQEANQSRRINGVSPIVILQKRQNDQEKPTNFAESKVSYVLSYPF
ncbi:unnamed protein product [Protopolystoma xenopodis]|uniref:Uncharacterized protein n=1 Tax=Protopolystoma xenopodis TaxID=117903 RepID=A0A3S5FET3_9PLAT|nr:unnamed protein product [Protopolystoma xenopodis]